MVRTSLWTNDPRWPPLSSPIIATTGEHTRVRSRFAHPRGPSTHPACVRLSIASPTRLLKSDHLPFVSSLSEFISKRPREGKIASTGSSEGSRLAGRGSDSINERFISGTTITSTCTPPLQQRFPSLRMVSERNGAHYRSLWDLLDPKPVMVRALASVLWTKSQSRRTQFFQFSNSQSNSSFPFSLTSPRIMGPPVAMNGSGSHSIWPPKTTMWSGWSSCPVEHDMQGDAVTVAAINMGAHRGVLMEELQAETRAHHGCVTRRSGSGYECGVFPSPYLSLGQGLSVSFEGS